VGDTARRVKIEAILPTARWRTVPPRMARDRHALRRVAPPLYRRLRLRRG